MNFSSPNRLIWQYFKALRRLVGGLNSDETLMKQDVTVCIILAVAAVEAFLNIFFRVVVSETGFTQHEQRVLDDLTKRRSLDHKLKTWPEDILGQSLDFATPTPQAFLALKHRRNALMHFTSSHQTLKSADYEIRGLADTTVFDTLSSNDAESALQAAEGMVCELLRLRGTPENQLPQALHMWTGKVPF
jgi:hypothetical protein